MTNLAKRPGLPWWIGEGNRWYDRDEQLEAVFTVACSNALPEDPELFWQIVGEVWKRTEFPHHQVEAWETIFSQSPGPNKYTQEWLKNPLKLYRGIDASYQDTDCDWSWTTDYDKADWFSRRFDWHKPEIKEVDCALDLDRVLCVFEDDTEHEVLLFSRTARELVYA